MAENADHRKLTAILCADVKGYSKLMGENESYTVGALKECRRLFTENIQNHGGRVVNAPGDSILAEFPSVVSAVQSAVEIQNQLDDLNADLPDNRKMVFRIGVNLGDVIQSEDAIYGDGVNIAARVEALADAGGICITRAVFEQIVKRIEVGFEYLGEHQVKNIAAPIAVYRVLMKPEDAGILLDHQLASHAPETGQKPVRMAVMPFENLMGGAEHDYFSIGFSEDLITDLTRFHTLQIISSYTSRRISAKKDDDLELAKELAIDYLLRGSLRRQEDRLRISTHLIDAVNGRIIWAERYETAAADIFQVQDDIVTRAVGAISSAIDRDLLAAAHKKPLTNLEAYDCWLHGMDLIRQGTLDADREAREIFKQALAIDPNYSRAYAGLSLSYFNEWSCDLWSHWADAEQNAYHYAVKALQIDDTDHIVQMILGRILLYRRQFELAEQHLNRSLVLNPNDPDNLPQIGTCMAFLGNAEKGEELFLKGLHLNPYRNMWYYPYGAFIYFVQRRYGQCIEIALKGPLTDVWIDLPVYVAAAYALNGERAKARYYFGIFLDIFRKKITNGRAPDIIEVRDWVKMANSFKHQSDATHLLEGFDAAAEDL